MNESTEHIEYVLGLLDEPTDRLTERAIKASPEQRRAVANWSLIISDHLLSQCESRPLPGWVWSRIERQLDHQAQDVGSALRRWRMAAAIVAMIGIGLLVGVFVPNKPPMQADSIAMMPMAQGQSATWEAKADTATQQIQITSLTTTDQPANKQAVLWLITPQGQTVAVGSLPMKKGESVTVRPALWSNTIAQTKLAISLEPTGKPIGNKPVGPVVWQGDWSKAS
jgi:anti-sigma-K factor RskA